MPKKSPFQVVLTDEQRAVLESTTRKYTSSYIDVVRAKIVLYAAEGLENKEIAARLDTSFQIVCKWRKRFFERGLEGLQEAPRRGRPPRFSPEVVVEAKAFACELPSERDLPLSRLSLADLRQEAIGRGLVSRCGQNHPLALVVGRCDPPLVPSQLDLSQRFWLCSKSGTHPGSV